MLSVPEIVQEYEEWVRDDKYLVMYKYNRRTGQHKFFAVQCSKRGNSTYKKRVISRFNALTDKIKDLVFFDPESDKDEYTPAMWITFTYDPKLRSCSDAWLKVGVEFNRVRSWLTRKYGKHSVLRCFESFQNGYPHIHALLVFDNYLFTVFKKWSPKRNCNIWRIQETNEIKHHWHSFIDVQGVFAFKGLLSYLKKYLTKSLDYYTANQKTIKTLALTWYYKKRAFAISNDLIKCLHNSNPIRLIASQTTLTGQILNEEVVIGVLGVVPLSILHTFPEKNRSFFALTDAQLDRVYEYLGKV